jgi:hypothetical protein
MKDLPKLRERQPMTKEEFAAFHERSQKDAEEAYKRRGMSSTSLGEKKETIPTLHDLYSEDRKRLDLEMAVAQEQIRSDEYSLEKRLPLSMLPPSHPRNVEAKAKLVNPEPTIAELQAKIAVLEAQQTALSDKADS